MTRFLSHKPFHGIYAILFFVLVACQAPPEQEKLTDLPRSTPEAEGVSSQGILNFLESADTSQHEFHSFMMVRHGKVIAEGWWNPYAPDLKHTMYSVSKSFTSTAIGYAVTEKKLTVNDKVVSFFPEYLPDSVSPYLAQLTVKDLLSMSVGQDPDPTSKIPGDSLWVKSFFETPILNEPGTVFLYNSMATYMLSAIVTKVTGEKVIDYLKPRLFDPLNITGVDWETDPSGANVGGWGFRVKTEDMAKFGQLLLQKGMWNGQQVLSAEWIEEATSSKILQSPEVPQDQRVTNDWLQGYCYQFWRTRHNSFRADGAFGQYILVLPDKDVVIAITSETSDMQGIMNLAWELLLPAMQEGELASDEKTSKALADKLASLALEVPDKGTSSPLSSTISGKTYTLAANDRGLQSVSFQLGDPQSTVTFNSESGNHTLPLGAGSWQMMETSRKGPYLVARAKNALEGLPPFKVATAYSWKSDSELELTLRYIESPHTERILCTFQGDSVKMNFNISFAPKLELPVIKGAVVK